MLARGGHLLLHRHPALGLEAVLVAERFIDVVAARSHHRQHENTADDDRRDDRVALHPLRPPAVVSRASVVPVVFVGHGDVHRVFHGSECGVAAHNIK